MGPSGNLVFRRKTLAMRIDDYKYRFIEQPSGWLGAKTRVDVPFLTNLRLDPLSAPASPSAGRR